MWTSQNIWTLIWRHVYVEILANGKSFDPSEQLICEFPLESSEFRARLLPFWAQFQSKDTMEGKTLGSQKFWFFSVVEKCKQWKYELDVVTLIWIWICSSGLLKEPFWLSFTCQYSFTCRILMFVKFIASAFSSCFLDTCMVQLQKSVDPVVIVDSMLGASWSSWNWVSDFLLIATSEQQKVAASFGWSSVHKYYVHMYTYIYVRKTAAKCRCNKFNAHQDPGGGAVVTSERWPQWLLRKSTWTYSNSNKSHNPKG